MSIPGSRFLDKRKSRGIKGKDDSKLAYGVCVGGEEEWLDFRYILNTEEFE